MIKEPSSYQKTSLTEKEALKNKLMNFLQVRSTEDSTLQIRSANETASSNSTTDTEMPGSSTESATASTSSNSTNTTIATPAPSSVIGNDATAENANASNSVRNTSNPTVAEDPMDVPGTEHVNRTETHHDLGNGTVRVSVQNVYRRRVEREEQRVRARHSENDTLSVPAIENMKPPRD